MSFVELLNCFSIELVLPGHFRRLEPRRELEDELELVTALRLRMR